MEGRNLRDEGPVSSFPVGVSENPLLSKPADYLQRIINKLNQPSRPLDKLQVLVGKY